MLDQIGLEHLSLWKNSVPLIVKKTPINVKEYVYIFWSCIIFLALQSKYQTRFFEKVSEKKKVIFDDL